MALRSVFYFFRRNKNTLLIIKNDGIGDYILFRNYIRTLKNSKKYQGFKIFLLANESSKDLALHLDSDIIDDFFWYADSYFLQFKLVKLLFELQRLRLHTIIYPNYSRKFNVDWLVNHVKAEVKIGVDGDTINETRAVKLETDKYFTQLIRVSTDHLHEFERNKEIIEIVTSEKSSFTLPVLERDKFSVMRGNGIVIFTGANSPDKKWPPAYFNKLCRLIITQIKVNVTLALGLDDEHTAGEICEGLSKDEVKTAFNLNIIELVNLIGSAKLLISGDTVAIHIAAALSVRAVCIAKGDLYGRFVPYPPDYHHEVETVLPKNFKPGPQSYRERSGLPLSDILPEDVFLAVQKASLVHQK